MSLRRSREGRNAEGAAATPAAPAPSYALLHPPPPAALVVQTLERALLLLASQGCLHAASCMLRAASRHGNIRLVASGGGGGGGGGQEGPGEDGQGQAAAPPPQPPAPLTDRDVTIEQLEALMSGASVTQVGGGAVQQAPTQEPPPEAAAQRPPSAHAASLLARGAKELWDRAQRRAREALLPRPASAGSVGRRQEPRYE